MHVYPFPLSSLKQAVSHYRYIVWYCSQPFSSMQRRRLTDKSKLVLGNHSYVKKTRTTKEQQKRNIPLMSKSRLDMQVTNVSADLGWVLTSSIAHRRHNWKIKGNGYSCRGSNYVKNVISLCKNDRTLSKCIHSLKSGAKICTGQIQRQTIYHFHLFVRCTMAWAVSNFILYWFLVLIFGCLWIVSILKDNQENVMIYQ